MKFYTLKTTSNLNHLRLLFGLICAFVCCYAHAQEVPPFFAMQAGHLLEVLGQTDGIREDVETVLGPKIPNNLLSMLKNFQKITLQKKISPELLSWSSGGTNSRTFKNKDLNLFFKNLFLLIEKSFPDITLSRVNLFHAHLVQTNDDFILVFHAFEYPIDLQANKFEEAQRFDPLIIPFTTKSESFSRRNLIWSLKKNKIWRIDTSPKSKFNDLVKSPAFDLFPEEVILANTLQEQFFGKKIANLNYFHREEKDIIVTD